MVCHPHQKPSIKEAIAAQTAEFKGIHSRCNSLIQPKVAASVRLKQAAKSPQSQLNLQKNARRPLRESGAQGLLKSLRLLLLLRRA
jgi:hypothetical protein